MVWNNGINWDQSSATFNALIRIMGRTGCNLVCRKK